MPEPARTGWGGKRKGAGRKPLGPSPLVRLTVRLPAADAQRLRELGAGNVATAVRQAVEAYLRHAATL